MPADWLLGLDDTGAPRPLESIQHGDLFPGNIFVDRADRHISVID